MIVLQIFKIIGIVLACIVGFVLLMVLLVLFTPITYKLSGSGMNEENPLTAGAKVKWLAGFITAGGGYEEKKLLYYVKLAGIKIIKGDMDLKKSPEELADEIKSAHALTGENESQKAETRKEAPAGKSDGIEITREDILEKRRIQGKNSGQIRKEIEADIRREEKKLKEQAKEAERQAKVARKAEKKENKTLYERFEGFIEKIREKYNKAKELYEKAKTVKYIVTAPVTRRALSVVKTELFHILGHIRPRSMKGHVEFSAGDPATTAQAYGVGGTFASMIDRRLHVIPNLEAEKSMVDADVTIGGRMFVGYIALCGLKIILNRDVKRVIKYTKKHLISSEA